MPQLASSPGAIGPLDSVLRRAGAVFGVHGGNLVALNFGSAAGELAACVHGVGLADRSEIAKLGLDAPPAQLSDLIALLAGRGLAAGQAFYAHGAWWCCSAPGRAVILCEEPVAERLRASLGSQRLRRFAPSVQDRSQEWAAIELIGRDAPKLLAELGAYDDPAAMRLGPSFTIGTIGGAMVHWLLESDRGALALVPRADALATWQAIDRVGRPYGVAYVGQEAAARFRLLQGAARFSAPM
jgi:glycine cleavage system aminomethyltransferase T